MASHKSMIQQEERKTLMIYMFGFQEVYNIHCEYIKYYFFFLTTMGMGVGGGFKSKISSIGQPDSAIKLQSYSHFADMKLGNYVWME